MTKIIFNKISNFKNYFSSNIPRKIGTKRNNLGISVTVLDLKTKESYEFVSIAKAARFFNTHPKTIWRIVYNNKLYLNRYQIVENNNNKLEGVWYIMYILYKYIYDYFYYTLKVMKLNKIIIYRALSFIILGILICIFIFFIFKLCIEIHDQYIFTLREYRANHIKCILEHKPFLNQTLESTKVIINAKRSNFIDIKEWRYEYLFNNKWTSVHNKKNELGIYQSIINNLNLDFNAKGTGTFSSLNSSYSSPIIERVNINNIFSNAISSTNTVNYSSNSLGIQGINYADNSNFVVIGDTLIHRFKNRELLNYQSNILYCLVNGLSPSLY